MTKGAWYVALGGVLFAFAACSSVATSPTGDCAQRAGHYAFKLTLRSGAGCSSKLDSLLTEANQPTSPAAPCTGSIGYGRDNCQQTLDVTCPDSTRTGYRISTLGSVTWNHDSTAATGSMEVSETTESGSSYCKGTYDAEVTKQ